jgi:glycosyltransferase involved in cell wall biosynthesis
MVKKKLLILYAKNPQEVFNPQSALGSYIYCLANILHNDVYDVYINGISVTSDFSKRIVSKSNPTKSNKISLKRFVPESIKALIKDVKLLFSISKLKSRIDANFSYDVILEMSSYGSNIGFKLSKKHNVPLYSIFDSPAVEEYEYFHGSSSLLSFIINNREKESLKNSIKIVVYAPNIKEFLINRYQLNTANFYIHQNVDFLRFDVIENKQINQPIVFGFIGSFLKWHRVDMLVEAFVKLRKMGYEAKLYLLGYGLEFEAIKNQVGQSAFKEDILMPGFVDGEDLKKYKRKIDVGILSGTTWYCAPNKLFEYGAANMAVIAQKTNTIVHIYKVNEDILVFDENNIEQLLMCMKKLLDDRALLLNLKSNLHQKIISEYSAQNTLEFYKTILD